MCSTHRFSKLFQPITVVSKTCTNLPHMDVTSKSQKLMLELGIIQQSNPGCYHLLPLGYKSLNKLIRIVDQEMSNIGGQKVMFPTLVNSKLWKKSGRYKDMGAEVFTFEDRHQHEYMLGPTHEETAAQLLSSLAPISYKHFPLLLYQITSKFRDEMKPRFGLIRGREFLMKDLYSFDVDTDSAQITYNKVSESYERVFMRIGVDFFKVLGTCGVMGGSLSHEYHYKTDIGEDKIVMCKKCNYAANMELVGEQVCPNCHSKADVTVETSIEVGHTFLLGDKYSKPLAANYTSNKSNKSEVLMMGSYGLGLTRIMAAAVEALSSHQEIRWPDALAPYNVVIVPPKSGSKEETQLQGVAEKLYCSLQAEISQLKDNIILDDRTWLTIGRRLLDSKRIGYRYVVVVKVKSQDATPHYELNDIKLGLREDMGESQLINYIRNKTTF